MSWTRSLHKIRTFEIDTLKKRLGEAVAAVAAAEGALRALDAELEAEARHARAETALLHAFPTFRAGWMRRRAEALAKVRTRVLEEQGCRDALSEAYTELKKVETIARGRAAAEAARQAREEGAALDEIARRRAPGA